MKRASDPVAVGEHSPSSGVPSESSGQSRMRSIDGVRGWAALIVVLHHTMLLDPWMSHANGETTAAVPGSFAERLIFYTPIHLFMAGPEAVQVFFALSGAVLVTAYGGAAAIRLSYLLPRLTRLYVPIFGAVLLAICVASVRPQLPSTAVSDWHAQYLHVLTLGNLGSSVPSFLSDLLVLPGTSFLDAPLWSMRVEIAMSMLLILVWAMARFRVLGFLAACGVAAAFRHVPSMHWLTSTLPLFVGGAGLALSGWRPSRRQGTFLVVSAGLALSAPFMALSFGFESAFRFQIVTNAVGALAITAASLGDSLLAPVLTGRVGQYLGQRSYSLYLVHLPVVLVASLWIVSIGGGQPNWWVWRLPLVMLALVVTEGFYRFVEAPAHSFSRRVRGRLKAAEARGRDTTDERKR